MSRLEIQDKLERRSATIGVVGLGMVGLPVACTFAQAGFNVVGVDLKAERVRSINAGRVPMTSDEPGLAELLATVVEREQLHATSDYRELALADVVTLNVETPVDNQHRPDDTALRAACSSLGAVLKAGALVIVESTVAPGTTEKVVRPLLEQASGLRCHTNDLSDNQTPSFFLGACPERITPGKLLYNLRHVGRVCGGMTPVTAQAMLTLYGQIVAAELDATDPLTAELVKTAENAYRDVQIAFANEVALICEASGADVWRVRELVNKTPGRQMHLPGAGVGGHCIPKDPWLLAHAAQGQAPLHVIPAARVVNEAMPLHVADLTCESLGEVGRALAQARVAVLGYAYLEESDDGRNSPSEALVVRLRELGAVVTIHDPFVSEYQGDLWARVHGCDAAVVMVAHGAYRALDLAALKAALRTPVLVDGRHVFDATRARAAGLVYRCVGVAAKLRA